MDDRTKAELAEQLLNSDFFKLIINSLREDYTRIWIQSSPEEEDLRKDAYYCHLILSQIENRLKVFVDNGKMLDDKVKGLSV